MRVIFVARPADDRPPKGEPDEESLGARWFTIEEMSGVELRADEARALARMVLDGAHIHPLSVLADG
jgi:phosphatase NudJ